MNAVLLCLATLCLAISSQASEPPSLRSGSRTLMETADLHPHLFGFRKMARLAGLEELLSGNDQLTIFAPSDSALNKIPSVEFYRLEGNTTELRRVLLQHCVFGARDSKALRSKKYTDLPSLLPQHPIHIRTETHTEGMWPLSKKVTELWVASNGGFSGRVEHADRRASNGVLHVIDSILLPEFPEADEWFKAPTPKWLLSDKAPRSLLEEIRANPELSVFASLVGDAGLLSSSGQTTVFAPTNAAFSKLPPGTLDFLKLMPGSLPKIAKYHMTPAAHTRSELWNLSAGGGRLDSVLGSEEGAELPLFVGRLGNELLVIDTDGKRATVVGPEAKAGDGVLHVVDAVLGLADDGRPGADAKFAKLFSA